LCTRTPIALREPCKLFSRLSDSHIEALRFDSTARSLTDDQPGTALAAQIGPQASQKDAELNSGTLQHCELLAHDGKIDLIKIAKWRRGWLANHLAGDGLGCVLALLQHRCVYLVSQEAVDRRCDLTGATTEVAT
jgi:hypothetical protein